MFGILFKQKNKNKEIAKNLYSCALKNTREEIFYTRYGVNDNFEGRFDLLVLHIFLIINRIIEEDGGKELSQEVFDITFKDIDQTLREMGVGDVGVPKRMKKMMLAFNGRMHAYQMAVSPETLVTLDIEDLPKGGLKEVLARNLYETSVDNMVDKNALNLMVSFVQNNLKRNNKDDIENLMSGTAHFIIKDAGD